MFANTAHADVVIVGAGSAGCVLAERLSRDPRRRVLLLEAGPDYADMRTLPADIADGRALANSHDWGYRSVPGPDGHALDIPRGKLVGGSSAVNACFALRGAVGGYDGWAAAGNDGWSFADVLPAFCATERDLDFGAQPWHGADGFLPVRRYPDHELTPLHRELLEAATRAGHATVDDHNAPGAVGAGRLPTNCVDGRRISCALAFLGPARCRPNLTVRAQVLVDRVVLHHDRATGVRLATGETVTADLVVLAAGSYGSPAILLRSGIGPSGELRTAGVTPGLDLSGVGRGLVDHPAASIDIVVDAASPTAPTFQSMVSFHSGRSPAAGPPDLQLFAGGAWPSGASRTGRVAALIVSVVQPLSSGRVWLTSPDPTAPPRIDLGHLREEADRSRMVEAMRHAREIAATPPLAASGRQQLAPGPSDWSSDAALRRWLRRNVWTYHHPVGTCRMGPRPAEGAVVDRRGRVHGLENVYVADASVMPAIPSANTNLPTIMVAERIAAMLVEP